MPLRVALRAIAGGYLVITEREIDVGIGAESI